MNRKKIIYIIITIIVFLTIIFFVFVLTTKDNPPPLRPIITKAPTPSPTGYQGIIQPTSPPEIQIKEDQQVKVTKFAMTLPYRGKNFALYYQPNNDSFILNVIQNNKETNKELDDFLKKNGIENRSWLGNIYINIVDKLSI